MPLSFLFSSGQEAACRGAGGFGVLRVTGKGTMGGKQNHMDSFFLAQPVLFDIMYLEKLLSAIWVTPSAA